LKFFPSYKFIMKKTGVQRGCCMALTQYEEIIGFIPLLGDIIPKVRIE
jgi:hypothetical protein